ncbi:MAG TPA: GNAT family protein [Thermomicrobiales bacterium]
MTQEHLGIQRVTLRRATIDDAERICAWRAEPSARRYQPLRQIPLEAVRDLIAFRARTPVGPDARGQLQWVIEAPEGPVGWLSVTIDDDDRDHGIGSIGYTVGEAYRGKGYATAAVAALLPIAFDPKRLNLERLEILAAVDNIASRRVAEQNGFQLEGILRGLFVINGERVDHALYALLRSDWLAAQGSSPE